MPDDGADLANPHLFISYSWSSAEHEAWVVALARRLSADGVYVHLDKWDLTAGQDTYAFMERMVTDPKVTKVLIVCDRAYAEKANDRRGGVGTEAQIISPQLYRDNSADQTKFAAACVELDANGRPAVPVFYDGRLHFDFTRRDGEEVAYSDLVRWVWSKPQHVRPTLGSMPAFETERPESSSLMTERARSSALKAAEAFRTDRLSVITARQTPAPLAQGAVAVVHMVPLPTLDDRGAVDIVAMIATGTHMPVPLGGRGEQVSVNFEGVCNSVGPGGYGELFRTGAYEGTHLLSIHDGKPYVASIALANMIVGAVRRGVSLQTSYDFPFPTAVMLSLCDARDVSMRLPTEFGSGYYDTQPLGRDTLAVPHVVIDGPKVDIPMALRPMLNAMWNAFGQARCEVYNGQGTWIGVA